MFVVLVYWTIKEGQEDEFIKAWKEELKPPDKSALVGEYLSRVKLQDGLNSWDLSFEGATTFVNVGIWRSEKDFVEQIGKHISSRRRLEKKFRVRATLAPFVKREGKSDLRSVSEDIEGVD